MTTGAIMLTTWQCDGRGYRGCGRVVRTESATEMPPGWIALDWWKPLDPTAARLETSDMGEHRGAEIVSLHFHEPDCLAYWLSELPITVGMKTVGSGNEPRKVQDAVGWSGRSPDRLFGCPSCARRDGVHEVGCTLHR